MTVGFAGLRIAMTIGFQCQSVLFCYDITKTVGFVPLFFYEISQTVSFVQLRDLNKVCFFFYEILMTGGFAGL